MTAFAIGKVVFAKCANVIVTSPATDTACLSMFDGGKRCNLSRLRRTGSDRMAFVAIYALPESVIRVTKNGFKNNSGGLSSAVGRELMTDTARADIAFRRVTGVTIRMCAYSDRN